MSEFNEKTVSSLKLELETIWAAHRAVGLSGQMALYTMAVQEPWRTKDAGVTFWFGENDIDSAIEEIRKHYNNGHLPNSPLLLNPLVHDENHKPIGSGVMWGTGLALGIDVMHAEQKERVEGLGVVVGLMERGPVMSAGMKMLAFSTEALPPLEDGKTVKGCSEICQLANFRSDEYAAFYLLSGLSYLGKHGAFQSEGFSTLVPEGPQAVAKKQVAPQLLADAAFCFNAYDRHHSLFTKFGVNPQDVEDNLKFYNLCARDIVLFDAVGAKHVDAATTVNFDFLVKGWIPRGAVTVIGASGGTGKSSLAHNLAVKAAIDYQAGEEPPLWLGSEIDVNNCKGICVYFSGEDGPAIVHSRAKVFDPEGRAERIMFQRTDFGEGGNLGTFLKRLRKLPEVPLVVIDPARKYLTGDENDAGVVSEFFEAIEEFAIQKHAAMVVVHHLAKGARPKHVSEIYDLLRGSQVFIDRPRVVIGMYREGIHTVAGLAKNNIPAQMGMIQGERLYVRDAKKLELVLVPGPAGKRGENLTEEEIEALRSAE
ncbi:MAG TPA: AAA family ATPase [Rickettsiales bacterium]|nr:AAA family ATPase [Rickettsiales bacterium]